MIIERYIIREIVKPTVVICTVLISIFGCYIATRYLADAVEGQLPGAIVVQLILLRITIALEVLLPTTLYLSVVIALGRLYRDAEMTAMFACGISPARVFKSVLSVAIMAGMLVACFSLYIRPWAWNQFFSIKTRAKATFDMGRMKGGNFYEIENGERVIFADSVDVQKNRSKNVFIQTKRDDTLQIIYAKQASQYTDAVTGKPILVFGDGNLYEFSLSEREGRILQFEKSIMPLGSKSAIQPAYRVKAATTSRLVRSNKMDEIAEWQWRMTAPVSTILLALLGVPLSRSSPRQGKFTKVPAAIVIFAVYYNVSAVMKKWVGQGVVDAVPGIWWVQILLAGFLLVLLWQPRALFRRSGR
jgi:lipopolysaccharide export system permease protein